ncbi:unnamed protein product [Caenorhabditis angaria]|uniref:Uncharacterized protein n=1 Tax=Caenorhabditis angaria TaxID=860376 RepID=A0A9P1IVT6_9PELO|nr:unnamed protein product [Caenorhabditis angaria]
MDFVAGMFGGAAGVLAGHPLDTVKVRLQTQNATQGTSPQYRGTWHCFSMIVKKEGFGGLYKGLSSPLASLSAINAIVFGVHGTACREFKNPDSIQAHFSAGVAAGIAQSVVAAPTERIKLLLQIQNDAAHTKYRGPIDATRQIVKKHGWRSLNRGFVATVARDAPAFGVYFASYEMMARAMSQDGKMESLTSMQLLLAGGGAGMLSWLFNYPADIIKSRFQADTSYKSYLHCIKATYAERGIRSFYIGLNSALIRAFPSNAATFFTVEWTYRLLLDFNVLGVGTDTVIEKNSKCKKFLTNADIWSSNSIYYLLLPEAGSTIIDRYV